MHYVAVVLGFLQDKYTEEHYFEVTRACGKLGKDIRSLSIVYSSTHTFNTQTSGLWFIYIHRLSRENRIFSPLSEGKVKVAVDEMGPNSITPSQHCILQ